MGNPARRINPGGDQLRSLPIVATCFKSLTILLMRTLVLLSLFSFVVKFGPMVNHRSVVLCFSFSAVRHDATA